MFIFRKFKARLLMVLICLVLGFSQKAWANDIILNDLNGQAVDLSSYKGKPVMLLFWTTWCPYCREELKNLNLQSAALAKEGIVVFGVNVNEQNYKVQKFFQGFNLNLKILLDKDGLLADKYDLIGVPTFVLLDKTGQVVSQGNRFPNNYKNLLLK